MGPKQLPCPDYSRIIGLGGSYVEYAVTMPSGNGHNLKTTFFHLALALALPYQPHFNFCDTNSMVFVTFPDVFTCFSFCKKDHPKIATEWNFNYRRTSPKIKSICTSFTLTL